MHSCFRLLTKLFQAHTVTSTKERLGFEGSCLPLPWCSSALSAISCLRLPVGLIQLSDLWLTDSALRCPNEREMWVGDDLNHGLLARDENISFFLASLIAPGNTFVATNVIEGNSLAQDKTEI